MGRITASRKQLKPDPVYGSILASKFINCLMWDGKKSTAQQIFYDALDMITNQMSLDLHVISTEAASAKDLIVVNDKGVGFSKAAATNNAAERNGSRRDSTISAQQAPCIHKNSGRLSISLHFLYRHGCSWR